MTNDIGAAGRRVEQFNEGWLFVPDAVIGDADLTATSGEPVTLPHTWNALDGQDGGNDYRRGASTYIKRFAIDAGDDEVWLEFRGANSSADVYLNGTHLLRHDGGYSTFRCELTPVLNDHRELNDHVIAVVVDNSPNSTIYPQRADFTFYGGIYRDVTLITVPRSHFALDDHGGPGLVVTPTLDGSRATVTFEAAVTGGDSVRFAIDGVGTQSATVVDGTAHGRDRDRRRATVARRARSVPLRRDREPDGRRRRRRRGEPSLRLPRVRRRSRPSDSCSTASRTRCVECPATRTGKASATRSPPT